VGAGLAGLTAAFRLQQHGWRVTLYEAADKAGGRVQTIAHDGYLIDTGASAVAESYAAYFELAEELGLREDILPSAPCIGIFRGGTIYHVRLDRMPFSAISSRVLSIGSKCRLLRLGFDILVAKAKGQLDYSDMRRAAALDTETAREYSLRALNREIDEYLGSPIVRTMVIANTDKVSKVELFSGIANIFSAKLYALKGGQARLVECLTQLVRPRLGCEVTLVAEQNMRVTVEFLCENGTPAADEFDACVVCSPLPAATKICPDKSALLAPLNDALTYTQAITVAIGTRCPPRSPATLVQMPACEDANVALFFLDHNKAKDRAPPGRGLIDCQWETSASSRMLSAGDESIVDCTLDSLYRVFPEVHGSVEFGHVTRWPQALPLTGVGIYKQIGDFNARMDSRSAIQFAGDYMGEAGQNTVVDLGNRAADRLQHRRCLAGMGSLGRVA